MSWDFETDPEFQKELDWIDGFVKEEVEPLDHVLGFPYEVKNQSAMRWSVPCRPRSRNAVSGHAISAPNSADGDTVRSSLR